MFRVFCTLELWVRLLGPEVSPSYDEKAGLEESGSLAEVTKLASDGGWMRPGGAVLCGLPCMSDALSSV